MAKTCSRCAMEFPSVTRRIQHVCATLLTRPYKPRLRSQTKVCPHCHGEWPTKNIARHVGRCTDKRRPQEQGASRRRFPRLWQHVSQLNVEIHSLSQVAEVEYQMPEEAVKEMWKGYEEEKLNEMVEELMVNEDGTTCMPR